MYYWRRRLPNALASWFHKRHLFLSLQTPDPNFARRLVVLLDAKLEEVVTAFEHAEMPSDSAPSRRLAARRRDKASEQTGAIVRRGEIVSQLRRFASRTRRSARRMGLSAAPCARTLRRRSPDRRNTNVCRRHVHPAYCCGPGSFGVTAQQ